MIPYPRFTKLIVSHYMTIFPEISRRAHDRYHNLADDIMIKSIFNSGKSNGVVRIKILDWMITAEMKLMENNRTTSAPMTVNPKIAEGKSSAPRREKSHEDLEAKQNMEKVKKHLIGEEIKKLVEGSKNVEENVEVASSPLRNDDNETNLGTRPYVIRPIDQDDPYDDAHLKGENSAKRQKTFEHGTFTCKDLLHKETTRTRKPKEEIYSNSKIVQIIKTYWELGHERKFITKIVVRRANGCIVSITKSDYKNLNKNDIEDRYLLIINHKVDDYTETRLLWSLSIFIKSTVIWERVHDFQLGVESYQQQVNLTAPTITFPGIEKYKVFSIVCKRVYGIIYKNNKKEKRVIRHQEVHKFCDAILKRVLEGLKSYNNNVNYGYVTHNLNKEDVEYL
uniref:Uncharacterized protein n=1 Tax=Tanacetum cinerariifolium TaxID=118510 RepID=A0A6L2K947_TANCI|nr:hypothetical protein [Tanacetum cinerariifolium]